MENQEYGCRKIKLNRIFNIQAKHNLIWLAVLFASSIVFIILGLVRNTFDWREYIISSCGCLVIMIVKVFTNPKHLEVTPSTIKFKYSTALRHLLIYGYLIGGGYEESYTLYDIKSIEYFQSSFDKMFSCGHIRICGEINIGNTGNNMRTFTIYGVKDFENTAAWMKEFVQLSSDI